MVVRAAIRAVIKVVVRAFLVRHVVWPFRLTTIRTPTRRTRMRTPTRRTRMSNGVVIFRVGREGFLVVFTLGYSRKTLLRFPSLEV